MRAVERILIAAYSFPPQGGIGGRRWAKFAKQLLRSGLQVEVVAADIPAEAESLWSADVEGISVHRFPTSFPAPLKGQPVKLIDKVKYRMALRKMVLKTKGTPYDRAALDQTAFRSLLAKRIDQFKPDAVIATGAPFDLLYFTALELEGRDDLISLADLRDPWVNGSAYGYSSLSQKRLEAEKAKEKKTVETFDLVTMPWPKNIEELGERHPSRLGKLKVLPHFYDGDDLGDDGTKPVNPPDLIYGGAVYDGLESILSGLSAFCQKRELKCEIRTSSRTDPSVSNDFFSIDKPLPGKEFFRRVKAARFSLLFLPEGKRYGLTKLYELVACGNPVFAIGKKGILSDLIVEKKLGYFVDADKLEADLGQAMAKAENFNPNREWAEQYSLSRISTDLIEMLNNALY